MAYDLIGALPTGTTPVWMRAIVTREGADIVTRCCVVAEGQVLPIEVRVNVPALAASLRAMGLVPPGGDSVSGFGSFLKKAVKAVTKNKVVKAVGKAVSKVVKSPIVQVMNPAAAIAIHTTARAATGKGTIKGAAGRLVNLGTKAVTPIAAPAALGFVAPKAAAALGIGLRTVQTARLGGTIASAAKAVQSQVDIGKNAAAALKAGTAAASKAVPLVQNAVKLRANVQKLGPQLAKQVVASSRVKTAIANIAARAKAGSADAKQAAAVIGKSAAALDKILRLQAQASGGIPGLLVTANGRIVRAPRGRFQLRTATSAHPDILYRGAMAPTLKGLFSAVSGVTEWGGHDDPGNELEGPLYPVRHEGGSWPLEDLSLDTGYQVAGVLTP